MHALMEVLLGLPILALLFCGLYFLGKFLRIVGRSLIFRLFNDPNMADDPVMSFVFGALPFSLVIVVLLLAGLIGTIIIG